MATRTPCAVRVGISVQLVVTVLVVIPLSVHSLDHLLLTGLLHDDVIQVAGELSLICSSQDVSSNCEQDQENVAVLPLIVALAGRALGGSRQSCHLYFLPFGFKNRRFVLDGLEFHRKNQDPTDVSTQLPVCSQVAATRAWSPALCTQFSRAFNHLKAPRRVPMSKKHSHYRFVPMVLLLAVVSLPITLAEQAVNPPLPLPGKSIPQFKQALPLLDVAGGTIQTVLDTNFEMQMCEFKASVLPPRHSPRQR